ncbi:MAG TPA: DUF6801 domain-containing protein [Streptosporangiaceae bacterium]|nr:DUF6801 domain-containing protein [Streptosporangiaceae bacterium]
MAGGLVLAAGALAAGVGVAADASETSAARNARLTLGYECQFPSGTERLDATIAAAFPVAAVADKRIQPAKVVITVQLPSATIAALRQRGAATVRSTTSLSVAATQRTTTITQWQGRTAAAQALPSAGSLSLVAAGHAAPVTVTAKKTVTFAAAGLTLALRFGSPSTASPSTSSPAAGSPSPASTGPPSTAPAGMDVTCVPASHSRTTIAAVQVEAASGSSAARAKPKIPKDCAKIKVIGAGTAVCGYVTGYSNVKKLYGAALLQPKRGLPALINVDFAYRHVLKHGNLIAYSTGELDYRGHRELPPVRATFLAFGFVPVTASLQVTELRPINIRSVSGALAPPYPITVTAKTTVAIRISDVDVNGVPLAIGPHCRPVSSARLTLIGRGDNTIPPKGYTVPYGGPLTGDLTIPAFTDCGVGENLDPLFTGSISGPGNYVLQTQGRLCSPAQPKLWTCPPPVPKPIH